MILPRNIILWFILIASLLAGCASVRPTYYQSNVDSLAQDDATTKKRYFLVPGNKDVEMSDLQFKEYAAYVDKVLAEKGFIKVSSAPEAEVVIFLSYAIGDPQTHQYSYSLPVWGQTGVSSASTYGTASVYGNSAAYNGTTTYSPSYGVTGYATRVGSITTYTRFLLLDAYDEATYKREKKMSEVWKTTVVSVGTSNDLRLIFPYMAASMEPYMGTSTGQKVLVQLRANDPAVQALRGTSAPTAK